MPNIYTIGETVLDLIFKDNQPVAAKAGGSMLNTSVSLGRLGLPVYFISEYGNDKVGYTVDQFLSENNINTHFVYRYSDGNTALALAFLDDKNNAAYDFYKLYPSKRLQITIPKINSDDFVLFGSFYGITSEIRNSVKTILTTGIGNNAVIYYDPNFRKAHSNELDQLKPLIIENMSLSSIVRCSNEDMEFIAGIKTPEEAYQFVSEYCKVMIYTNSTKGVYVFTPNFNISIPVKKIKPVSTIGAGDTFNAGVVFGLFTKNITSQKLTKISKKDWSEILEIAVTFATEVCMSYENYISIPFAGKYLKG